MAHLRNKSRSKLGNKERKLPREQTLNCKTPLQSDGEKVSLAIFSFKNKNVFLRQKLWSRAGKKINVFDYMKTAENCSWDTTTVLNDLRQWVDLNLMYYARSTVCRSTM